MNYCDDLIDFLNSLDDFFYCGSYFVPPDYTNAPLFPEIFVLNIDANGEMAKVYGFTRTGCCGCSISSKAVEDLEKLKPYEPNLYKAAWNVFGDSYRYRAKYNEYRKRRNEEGRSKGQTKLGGFEGNDNN